MREKGGTVQAAEGLFLLSFSFLLFFFLSFFLVVFSRRQKKKKMNTVFLGLVAVVGKDERKMFIGEKTGWEEKHS